MRSEPASSEDVPLPRTPEGLSAPTAGLLQSVSGKLALAGTPAEVLDAVADEGARLLGAEMVDISLLDPRGATLRLVTSRSTPMVVESRFSEYPADAPLPTTDALLTGRPVLLTSTADRDRRYPVLSQVTVDQQASCVLPLLTPRRQLGVLGLGWRSGPISDETVALAELLAGLTAGALERALTFEAETTARRAAEEAEARLLTLQHLAAALAETTTMQQVGLIIAESAANAVGAEASSISVLAEDGATGTVVAARGLGPPVEQAGQPFRLDQLSLGRELLQTRRPVIVRSLTERDIRFPDMRDNEVRQQAWVNLLLEAGGRPVGVASFGWTEPRDFSPGDVAMLEALGRHCTAALERARLFDAERTTRAASESAQHRLALLARISRLLAEGVDEERLLADLLRLLVGEFGHMGAVLLPDDSGRLIRRQVTTTDPASADLAAALLGQSIALDDPADPRSIAWSSRHPACCPDVVLVADALTRDDPGLAARMTDLRIGPMISVPMTTAGRRLGVLSVFRHRGRPAFDEADAELLAEVGQRTAGALETLRLLDTRTRVAAALQRSLLPEQLPVIDDVELASRYAPADSAAEVGGDFYDAFPLGDGSYALIIGDVAGRGIDAAALTGLARAQLQGLDAEIGPAEALSRLNRVLLSRTGAERFLTAAYLRLWPDSGPDGQARLQVAVAGHPLPLLVDPSGAVQPLGRPGSLLGLLEVAEISQTEVVLTPGTTVVLFTDGVIEAHGPFGLFGEQRLTELLAAVANQPAEDVAAAVERAVLAYRTGGPDDLAVLVTRWRPDRPELGRLLVDCTLPAHTRGVRQVRDEARRSTAGMLTDEQEADLLLALSELASNAVRHCAPMSGDPADATIRIRLWHRTDRLHLEVTNPGTGLRLPAVDKIPEVADVLQLSESGRGLGVARRLATDSGADSDGSKTRVWLDLALDREPPAAARPDRLA
ncbi:MAG TPA: SpoIIE family protein phosphatase [Frankiaceae bacterium]|nr:SpoIIE family protein phosphatase [Frankiaceae bacterium]